MEKEEFVQLVISSGETDAAKLNSILPPEIWEVVFENVKQSEDVRSLCESSSYFKDALYPTRILWLFEEIYPFVCHYLNKNSILSCRKVCNLWRNGVDSFTQNVAFLDPVLPSKAGYQLSSSGSKSSSYKEVQNFDRDFGQGSLTTRNHAKWFRPNKFFSNKDISAFVPASTGNPFPTRSVKISCSNFQYNPKFWSNVISFLKCHGHHIWVLDVAFVSQNINFFEAIHILRGCLLNVPNLRKLIVHFQLEYFPVCKVPKICIANWRRSMSQRPFPELVHLEELELEAGLFEYYVFWGSELTFPTCYYQQTKRLNVIQTRFLQCIETDKNLFTNLGELVLTINSGSDLQKLAKLSSPLKRLKMTLDCGEVGLEDCFKVANVFRESLVVLEISVYGSIVRDELPQLHSSTFAIDLKFSTLKIVKIVSKIAPPEETLNFLVRVSSETPFTLHVHSEELCVTEFSYFVVHPNDHLKIHGYVDRMHKSAIWELVQSLAEFRFSGYNKALKKKANFIYSREDCRNMCIPAY